MTLSPEEIAQQQQLLDTHRRTLAVYLQQQAQIGRAYSPPALVNGIEDTRNNIKRIKALLNQAGAVVIEDPDDEEALPPRRQVPTPSGSMPNNFLAVVVGALVVAVAISVGWWFYNNPPNNTASPEEQVASSEEIPATQNENPSTDIDLEALESQLAEANIELSAVQVEQVREYVLDPETGYRLLAERALEILGDQRFIDTIFLDELDVRYTELVGTEHFADFDEEQLKEGMVLAWNGHYTENQVDTFDEIVEPRP